MHGNTIKSDLIKDVDDFNASLKDPSRVLEQCNLIFGELIKDEKDSHKLYN